MKTERLDKHMIPIETFIVNATTVAPIKVDALVMWGASLGHKHTDVRLAILNLNEAGRIDLTDDDRGHWVRLR